MRKTFVYRDGEWVPKGTARRVLTANVIMDTHAPFKSMADGKVYDSKSAYRRSLPEGMVEIGNDEIKPQSREPASAIPDIERAMAQDSHEGPRYIEDIERAMK